MLNPTKYLSIAVLSVMLGQSSVSFSEASAKVKAPKEKKAQKQDALEVPDLKSLPKLAPLTGGWKKYEKDIRLAVESPANKVYLSKAVATFNTHGVNKQSVDSIASDGRVAAYKGPKLAVTPKLAKYLYALRGNVDKEAREKGTKLAATKGIQDPAKEALAAAELARPFMLEGKIAAIKNESDPLLQALTVSAFRSNKNRKTGIIYIAEAQALTMPVGEFEGYVKDQYQNEIVDTTEGLTTGHDPAGVTRLSVHYILGSSDSANWRKIKAGKQLGYLIYQLNEEAVFAGPSLKKGDVLVGLNNKSFADEKNWGPHFGPDVAFGNAIEKAETTGHLTLHVKRATKSGQSAEEVLEHGKPLSMHLKVKKAPAFAANMPFDCKKSEKIADDICAYFAEGLKDGEWKNGYYNNLALLALLSADKPEYDKLVKKQLPKLYPASAVCNKRMCTWKHTSSAIVLCEYYLKTKDKEVLPAIQTLYEILAAGQLPYYGSGHSCQGGDYRGSGFTITSAHTLLSFSLMQKCDIKMDDERVQKSLNFIISSTNHGCLDYGALKGVQKGGGDAQSVRYDGSTQGPGARNGVASLAARLLGNTVEAPDYSDHLIRGIRHDLGKDETRYAGLAHTHGCKIMGLLWGACAMAANDEAAYSEMLKKHIWHLQLARLENEQWIKEHPASVLKDNYEAKPSTLWNATYALILNARKHNLYITGKAWEKSGYKLPLAKE